MVPYELGEPAEGEAADGLLGLLGELVADSLLILCGDVFFVKLADVSVDKDEGKSLGRLGFVPVMLLFLLAEASGAANPESEERVDGVREESSVAVSACKLNIKSYTHCKGP